MSDCSTPETYDDGTDSSYDSYDASTTSMSVDTDQDGIAETTMIDFNGDGVADAFDVIDPNTGAEMISFDSDGDGLVDTIVVDNDGDMVFDEAYSDTDGDGQLDTSLDPNTGEPIDGPFTQYDDPSLDPTSEEGTEEGSEADDSVHGEPMAEIPYHQAQVGPNDCLPTSVAMVLTEITGTEVPQGDVVDLANELGLLGENGMTLEGGLALFEHYGVEAEVQTGSVDDLRTMLDSGTEVVIGLDSDDLYGTGDEPFADDLVAGHAVVITGIDDEAGLVYINDPGFPDGAGVAIPIEQFEDAWADAGNGMIVATDSGDDVTEAGEAGSAGNVGGTGSEDEGVLDSIAKFVLLPFDLVLR
ncbi:MAG: C39 family peptidase [Actinomycetota bacterium]|nr:C39 family peptidase [Actinomycetota bacterium]